MKRVLVTGNLGYIGAVLTPMLARAGYDVWGLDTGYYEDCSFDARKDSYHDVQKQIHKDIRDVTEDDLVGIHTIIHLAALSNDPTGELDPEVTEDINYRASVRLARMARTVGVKRFLFASSCSIYGQGKGERLTEQTPFHPVTAYARSKVKAEADISALADDRFSPVFMRNATAYGLSPRLRLDLVVNNLTGWAYSTNEVKLLSDGTAWRPIVHVEDISRAFIAALAGPRDVVHNHAFNVGQDVENYRIRDIAEVVARVVPGSTVTRCEGASADSRTYNVSFEKIRETLPGFRPLWNLERGIRQLCEGFKACGLAVGDLNGSRYIRIKQLQALLKERRVDAGLRWNGTSTLTNS